jgi:hypothetical protein
MPADAEEHQIEELLPQGPNGSVLFRGRGICAG